ncbi:hypothetical protein NSA47_02275 [Irregularibacter muris]|uniref:Uncharacterized protein n=1 Tax=Irregularibacter muris TaxID=1796619 RepID=A0AAE3HES1_9FIRM|nr:hypothetical protein [Irregularibacter muris]MCR1897814.1 hypothetical protein [Irregularibacter muris]
MFTPRNKKVAFLDGEAGTFNRMKGFTALSTNKNPKEYTRQYIDEAFETTDVVAISTSIDFTFDQMQNDPVHEKLVDIIDKEKIGDGAMVTLAVVDLTQPGTTENSFKAVKRDFVVVPGTEGDNVDAYTYGGTFKVKGSRIEGEATSTDGWETCTFTKDDEAGI